MCLYLTLKIAGFIQSRVQHSVRIKWNAYHRGNVFISDPFAEHMPGMR